MNHWFPLVRLNRLNPCFLGGRFGEGCRLTSHEGVFFHHSQAAQEVYDELAQVGMDGLTKCLRTVGSCEKKAHLKQSMVDTRWWFLATQIFFIFIPNFWGKMDPF